MAEKSSKGGSDTNTSSSTKQQGMKNILLGLGAIVLIAAIAASIYFYSQYKKSQQLLQNPAVVQQQQSAALLTTIGKLIELPQDETPTIATVSDVTKLAGQPFFARAKNGDKVLIYTKNKKAILYDPTANIIVNVAPINIGSPTPTVFPSPTPLKRVVPKVTVSH